MAKKVWTQKKQRPHKMHVKTGDTVQVIAGRDKGYVGEVIKAFPKEHKIVVKGANTITKHQKPRQQGQQGQILTLDGKMDSSNVLLYCDKCGRGVRYGKRINEDGTKSRICKRCGSVLDNE